VKLLSKQVYFVVGVDLDSKEPFIDDDTFTARFSKSEQVWDTELNEWVNDPELELYAEALEILNKKRPRDD
jgi:superoxide dismutase